MTYEDIWIGEDGYSKDSFKNKWNIHGTTYKEYNEHGGLEWVSSLLNVGDKTMDLLDSFGSVRNVFDEEIHQVRPTHESVPTTNFLNHRRVWKN